MGSASEQADHRHSQLLEGHDAEEDGAVERVNSRLAGRYGFDHPFIRGLTKMRLRMTMGLTIMLAMALGRIQAGQPEHLRSLVKAIVAPAILGPSRLGRLAGQAASSNRITPRLWPPLSRSA